MSAHIERGDTTRTTSNHTKNGGFMQTITTRTLAPIANEKEEEQLGRR
jgi:hypothetical protein